MSLSTYRNRLLSLACTRQGKALLNKFCEVQPEGYDEVAARDTRPVKRAAELLSGMVKALPAILHASISQLMPYFGCE